MTVNVPVDKVQGVSASINGQFRGPVSQFKFKYVLYFSGFCVNPYQARSFMSVWAAIKAPIGQGPYFIIFVYNQRGGLFKYFNRVDQLIGMAVDDQDLIVVTPTVGKYKLFVLHHLLRRMLIKHSFVVVYINSSGNLKGLGVYYGY